MNKKENKPPNSENIHYPISIVRLLQKYPKAQVISIEQHLKETDFIHQKSKQYEYPIEGGAIGIITTTDNSIILTKRTRPHSGWALPGGRVELGEIFEDAFVREVKEECGVDIVVNDLIMVEDKEFISPSQETIQFWLAVFSSSVVSNQQPYQTTEARQEGLEVGIFTVTDLPSDMVLQDREKIIANLKL